LEWGRRAKATLKYSRKMFRTSTVRWAWHVLGATSLAGCAAGAIPAGSASASQPQECAVQLPPAQQEAASHAPTPTPIRAARESQLVVHAEAPLSTLSRALEQRIQKRLAEGHFGIGPGGTVNYRVERGALSLSVTSTSLVIEAPVSARAEACRGQGCYASCEPNAVVRASVPLLLRSDYRFEPSATSLRFTRGCQVHALGGLLTIDLTPTLESQLQPELAEVSRQIDQQLPDIRADVERAWAALATPRPLPLSGCLRLQPRAIVQGALTPSTTALRANFAVLATPELRSQCGDEAPPPSLPPLSRDLSLPEEGAVLLGMVTPLEGFEPSFLAAAPVPASQRSFKITGARVAARASDVDVTLELAGDVCGTTTVGAVPDFSGNGASIELARPTLDTSERARWKAAGIDSQAPVTALIASAHVTPLLSVSALRDAVPALAQAMSPPSLQVSARVSSAHAAGAAARGNDLVAWVEARGSVTLRSTLR
jgi:hypothetical protein